MLENRSPEELKTWNILKHHYRKLEGISLNTLFENDSNRASRFSLEWNECYLDYSKNIITSETFDLLCQLAKESNLREGIDNYFSGQPINETENRSVLHTALRKPAGQTLKHNGQNIIADISKTKANIKRFSEDIISGRLKSQSGKPFTDVINIGIGGSDLGPAMVVEALKFYSNHLNIHFVNNVDGDHVMETLKSLNPETTLVIVVSKTFTTQETLCNADTVRAWIAIHCGEEAVSSQFVAVSSNIEKVKSYGISEEHIFPMWDWVGGRFSLWSAVGLSISLSVGYDNFNQFLDGAYMMDKHFQDEPYEKNMPIILALISIWYNNFFNCETEAVIPYCQYLSRFPAYLQQAVMESNGKSVDRKGKKIEYQTGNIIWGEPGTNAQHAFFQLIHQGTKIIPTDFIGFAQPLHGNVKHHNILIANFIAQTEALMKGKTECDVKKDLQNEGFSEASITKVWPFKVFAGNKPTNTLLMKKLTPKNLGSLISMYEHKIFVQGYLLNIFSFDQWGVELGKKLATNILNDISQTTVKPHDQSTLNLINKYKFFNR